MASDRGPQGFVNVIITYLFYAVIALVLVYLVGGIVMGTGAGILGGMSRQLLPVWIALIVSRSLHFTLCRSSTSASWGFTVSCLTAPSA